MDWFRYLLYFIAIALITWALTQMEIASPGSLKLHILMGDSDVFGTSEFSPVEIIQAIILILCSLIMGWVVRYCPSQRPIAFGFGGLALIFLMRAPIGMSPESTTFSIATWSTTCGRC